jgi:hypothetical protein
MRQAATTKNTNRVPIDTMLARVAKSVINPITAVRMPRMTVELTGVWVLVLICEGGFEVGP